MRSTRRIRRSRPTRCDINSPRSRSLYKWLRLIPRRSATWLGVRMAALSTTARSTPSLMHRLTLRSTSRSSGPTSALSANCASAASWASGTVEVWMVCITNSSRKVTTDIDVTDDSTSSAALALHRPHHQSGCRLLADRDPEPVGGGARHGWDGRLGRLVSWACRGVGRSGVRRRRWIRCASSTRGGSGGVSGCPPLTI